MQSQIEMSQINNLQTFLIDQVDDNRNNIQSWKKSITIDQPRKKKSSQIFDLNHSFLNDSILRHQPLDRMNDDGLSPIKSTGLRADHHSNLSRPVGTNRFQNINLILDSNFTPTYSDLIFDVLDFIFLKRYEFLIFFSFFFPPNIC